ncbi:mandelate racemase/muconate lactonizing enzyme family protein [Bosea sp. RAF48]|uniref:mandelate racemase/muconate lactonizing enzyme family protein n=1 Tax=Bosea sp. RAF48 TaxID=3237480 RepID=UPI003F8FB6C0
MSDPITKVEPIVLRIPFDDGGKGQGITPTRWSNLDIVLVRVETGSGLVGWGEAFGYMCQNATAVAVRDLVAPAVIGRNSQDPQTVNLAAQQALALFGRYGITMFAISGLDIALWDIAGKRAGLALSRLIGPPRRDRIRAYASLVRYGDAERVAHFAAEATALGYDEVKLHEVLPATIAAGRRGAGSDARLTVDVNCQWSLEQVRAMLPVLAESNVNWLEEPTFPPEDPTPWRAIAAEGIAIAAGENACTAVEFGRLVPALDIVQPSVTKVGGVTEFVKVAQLARAAGKRLAPHSPYFGPGYWASLQLAAAIDTCEVFEFLYVRPEAWCGLDPTLPVGGAIGIPDKPGIGFEPDMSVIERYRS